MRVPGSPNSRGLLIPVLQAPWCGWCQRCFPAIDARCRESHSMRNGAGNSVWDPARGFDGSREEGSARPRPLRSMGLETCRREVIPSALSAR